MSQNFLIAVLINIGMVLLLSWAFFIYLLGTVKKKNTKLEEKLREAKEKLQLTSSELRSTEKELKLARTINADNTSDDEAFASLLEQSERANSTIKAISEITQKQANNLHQLQESTDSLNGDDDKIRTLKSQLSTLESQVDESDTLVSSLKSQAAMNRTQLAVLETKLSASGDQSRRIQAMGQQETKLRHENLNLRNSISSKEAQVRSMTKFKSENTQLRGQITRHINQNNTNKRLISNLQDKLKELQHRATEAKRAQQEAEKKAAEAAPLDQSTSEVDSLKDTLERTQRENKFLEKQYMELLGQIDDTSSIAEQLERSQSECAMLEQAYMELARKMDEVKKNPPEQESSAEEAPFELATIDAEND